MTFDVIIIPGTKCFVRFQRIIFMLFTENQATEKIGLRLHSKLS